MLLRYIYTDEVTCPNVLIENSYKNFEDMIKVFQTSMIDGFPDHLLYKFHKNMKYGNKFLPENIRSKEANWSLSCKNLVGFYNIAMNYAKREPKSLLYLNIKQQLESIFIKYKNVLSGSGNISPLNALV